jgi:hypothetical protein
MLAKAVRTLAQKKSSQRPPFYVKDTVAFHRLCSAGDACLNLGIAYDQFSNGFFREEVQRRVDGWYMAAIEFYWMALGH